MTVTTREFILRLLGRRRRMQDRLGEFSNTVGSGMVFRGGLTGQDNSIIYGQVEGVCALQGTLVLAPGSSWCGDIVADNILVAGEVKGNITALSRLELAATARVTGNLASPSIAIARGAVYEGKIQSPRKVRKTYYEERRARTPVDALMRVA